jgi:putative nucleotidyltransferase with HDIG domain
MPNRSRLLLVAASSPAWFDLVRRLFVLDARLETVFQPDIAAALALLDRDGFDAVAVDLRLPDSGALALLTAAERRFPQVLRFVLADDPASPAFGPAAQLAHEILPQPCEAATLRAAITEGLTAASRIRDPAVGQALLRLNTLPDTSALRQALLELLADDDIDGDRLEEGLNRDPAVAAKILQVANSAYYGSRFGIASLGEAISIIGLDTVRGIVTAGQVFSLVSPADLAAFSLANLWHHSVVTGVMVRRVAVHLRAGVACGRAALTAALLHDVGKIVLHLAHGDRYAALARECWTRGCALWPEEVREFGLHHGMAGARLLELWGLPPAVVEAVEFHHQPHRSNDEVTSPLTLVHLANGLAHGAGEGSRAESALDLVYLRRLLPPEEFGQWMANGPLPAAAR